MIWPPNGVGRSKNVVDVNWQLTEYLGKTTVDAAAAGLQLMDWLAAYDQNMVYSVANGRIYCKSTYLSCTLHPKPTHITCRIHDNGRSYTYTLIGLQDMSHELWRHLRRTYREAKES
jgi:hypothetical protein